MKAYYVLCVISVFIFGFSVLSDEIRQGAQQAPSQNPVPEVQAPESGIEALEKQQEEASLKKSSFVQFALFSPVQVFSKRYSINGWRMNLFYSENQSVNGLDIAACGLSSSKDFNGLQLGLGGWAREVNGVQILAFSGAARHFNGFQLAVLDVPDQETRSFNGARIDCLAMPSEIKSMRGFLIAGIFSVCEDMAGFQFSYASVNDKTNGVQCSATFNQSDELNGLQIGIFNYTDSLSGAQIGLINFAPDNWLPISIGINAGF